MTAFQMTISGLQSAADAATAKLVKLLNGEYTVSSVVADPTDAIRLGLVKEADGNYGLPAPGHSGGAASAQLSSTVLARLDLLKRGG